MSASICAGFGDPIGRESHIMLARLGFDRARQDVRGPGDARAIVADFVDSPLRALFVAGGGANDDLARKDPSAILWTCRAVAEEALAQELQGVAIEAGNELDACSLYRDDPDRAGRLWQDAEAAIRLVNADIEVITGGVTNLSSSALSWLDRAILAAPALTPEAVVGFHSYRENPRAPKAGFPSREAEMGELARIARGRRTWCTEVGYHTASGRGCLGRKTKGLTDQQVEDFCYAEQAWFLAFDIDLAWYQINDGPKDVPLDRYGIRRTDGTLKPVAGCFT
jgi:hypothetical protein